MSKKQSRATKQAASLRAAERAASIRQAQASKERRRRTVVVAGIVIVVLALIFGIGYGIQSNRDTTGQAAAAPAGASGYAIPIGKSTAKAKVAVYEDFMCPYCGQFESLSRSMLQKSIDNGDVQMKYHVVAFLDNSSTTAYSTRAANAFAAVLNTSGQNIAKKFHDLLYEHQPQEGSAGLSDQQLVALAVQAGAPRAPIQKAVTKQTYKQWVANGTNAASQSGVNQTPTVVVNGKTLPVTSETGLISALKQSIATASS